MSAFGGSWVTWALRGENLGTGRPPIAKIEILASYVRRRVFLPVQNMANWPGNIGGRQCSGRDLVE